MVFFGAPKLIEKAFVVDVLGGLSLLRPRKTTLHFYAQLGRRINRSTHACPFVNVRSGPIRDIRELGWYPGPVVVRIELDLMISLEQVQPKVEFWNILHCDFCVLHEVSGWTEMKPSAARSRYKLGVVSYRWRATDRRCSQVNSLGFLSSHV